MSNSPNQVVSERIGGTGALGMLAREVARLARLLNNIRLVGPGSVTTYSDRIEIRTNYGPWSMMPFWYAQENNGSDDTTGAKLTIRTGNLRIHGTNNIVVPETEIIMTGITEWIYVEHARGSGTASINHSSSEPVTNSTHLRVPLYNFELDTSLNRYKLADQGLRRFDINFDTPLQ